MLSNSTIPVRAVGASAAWQVVRRAALKDLDSLVPFARSLDDGQPESASSVAHVRALLERTLLAWGSRLIVAEVREQIVGFCAYDTREARLRALYVAEASRGRGLGRELLAFAEQDLARASADGVWVELPAERAAAQAFFARQGYALVGQPGPADWVKCL
jgi:ribosomal protein S18 acetylase RimI-like enzyme